MRYASDSHERSSPPVDYVTHSVFREFLVGLAIANNFDAAVGRGPLPLSMERVMTNSCVRSEDEDDGEGGWLLPLSSKRSGGHFEAIAIISGAKVAHCHYLRRWLPLSSTETGQNSLSIAIIFDFRHASRSSTS
jgi:hypothetical protein